MTALENEPIFALDIGTRTVIGVLAEPGSEGLSVLHQAVIEHSDRAMYDGQIHDIPRVAAAVAKVRESLETASGSPLSKVAVAAAGRSLQTYCCRAEREIDPHIEIDQTIIHSLEMLALSQSHTELIEQEKVEGEHLYCVGYSVVRYHLDGLFLANLLGHRGERIGIEAIVTFLPASVVNGLLSVLHRIGLEPISMTLEPIAALDVAIPPDVRILNLALVDIGAGTSDIALTLDGSILAYGMVPLAGDEITEGIMKACLADFSTAEDIKRNLATQDEIVFQNILGLTETWERDALLDAVNPVLEHLVSEIASSIRHLNGGESPSSVILIGGGAQFPSLPDRLARALELPSNRVVVRGRDMLHSVHVPENDCLAGSQGITVLGIASLAARLNGNSFLTVRVNGKEHHIFNSRSVTVAYILGLVEFDIRKLFGKNGRNLTFTLNGNQETVRGGLCRPARLMVNDGPANLQTPIQDGDEVIIIPAENGADATALVGNYFSAFCLTCTVNGKQLVFEPTAILNDLPAPADAAISPGDVLLVSSTYTITDVLKLLKINSNPRLTTVDSQPVDESYVVQPGDDIETQISPAKDDRVKDETAIQVCVNGQVINLTGSPDPIFIDIFKFFDVSTQEHKGNPKILLNNKPAQYTQPLQDGDQIQIIWGD